MCMLYVNAALGLYADVRYDAHGNTESLVNMFDSLEVAASSDGQPVLPGFKIVTRICILGSNRNEENILRRRGKLAFKVRLTKCDPEPENQLGRDLAAFLVDLSDPELSRAICRACFDYLNYTQVTNVTSLKLAPGPGKYVLKLLIAEQKGSQTPADEEFTVQSMYPLTVGIRQ